MFCNLVGSTSLAAKLDAEDWRNLLIDWPPSHCLHCRKPIIVGQTWTAVANGLVEARFHGDCHGG
jgi:hypothetical protein